MMIGAGGAKELLSAGEIDDFSLFQLPMEGGQQETDVNNTFHEINQSGKQSKNHRTHKVGRRNPP